MRKLSMVVLSVAIIAVSLPVLAELQNVDVGGQIRIRGSYYSATYEAPAVAQIRWPASFVPNRPIGGPFAAGGFNGQGVVSLSAWDESVASVSVVEQRTNLYVSADFTNEVKGFIEFDNFTLWGEDFRSNYITGVDNRSNTNDDLEVFQSYIEADHVFDTPLRVRVGRQILSFGNEWLVGSEENAFNFYGTSFDAIRLTYATDLFSVDAWASTLAEGGSGEEDEDVAFFGLYASYLGLENITLDAYWMYVRDARSLNDTNFVAPLEWLEDVFNLDDYDPTNLHTVGLRGAGTIGAFDFSLEAAYQFGEADSIGSTFRPLLYGDDDADFDSWAANLILGYRFDVKFQPRLFLIAAYFDGEDNRDITFRQWLNPFDRPESSISFNRLFSTWEYSEFVWISDESNFYTVDLGVEFHPTEALDVMVHVADFWTVKSFDAPRSVNLGRFTVPVAPALSFWTQENDDHLWTEVGLYLTYHYSEDLTFAGGYCRLFTHDGLEEGNFNAFNGLAFNGGRSDDDGDYLYAETILKF